MGLGAAIQAPRSTLVSKLAQLQNAFPLEVRNLRRPKCFLKFEVLDIKSGMGRIMQTVSGTCNRLHGIPIGKRVSTWIGTMQPSAMPIPRKEWSSN